ncbi:hypothetical protein KR009_002817 [Drosophila setifemur]|nr:hypothetical protein KR009_002817 [Drosophila setifemur]
MAFKIETVFCLLILARGLTIVTGEVFPQCDNADPDTFVKAIDDCASYVYCNGEDSFRDSCPEHTFFDESSQECAFDDAGTCLRGSDGEPEASSSTPPIVAIGTSPAPSPAAAPGAARPQCDSSGDGVHPHPQRCEYYYRCLSGYLTIVRCPLNSAFDFATDQCLPKAEAQCYSL